MILKTRAIALRFSPFSETSRAVTWLTDDFGKMTTLIKGSQRPKGDFLGQFDLFYTCELLVYHRDRDGLFITRECSPLASRDHFRSCWRSCAAASYLSDLLRRSTEPHTPQPGLFRFLETALDELQPGTLHASLILWFELHLLHRLGFAPRTLRCVRCDRPVRENIAAPWSTAEGGVICSDCAPRRSYDTRIGSDTRAVLAYWQNARTLQAIRNSRCHPRQLHQLSEILGRFIRHHLDHRLPSRDIALSLLLPAPAL